MPLLLLPRNKKDVDARRKAGHDDSGWGEKHGDFRSRSWRMAWRVVLEARCEIAACERS